MIVRKNVHHPNDVSTKYLQETNGEELFNFFKLPGKFVKSYPKTIVRRDGSQIEMDWLVLADPDNITLFERTLINVEFQTKRVSEEKIKVISDYKDYSKTYFALPVLTIIIVFDEKEYEESLKEYCSTASDILRPIYIHMPWKEIEKRFNNLKSKINNRKKLSKEEAFDIAFLPMFAPKQKAGPITETITKLFKMEKTLEEKLKSDIAYVLGIMIRKYFDCTTKGKELLKLIEKEIDKSALMDVIEYELDYREQVHKAEINEKNKEILAKDQEIHNKDKEIQNKDKEIHNKDKEIQNKDKEIHNKDKEIHNKDKEIQNKDKEIHNKDKEIQNKDKENAKLKAKLEENGIAY